MGGGSFRSGVVGGGWVRRACGGVGVGRGPAGAGVPGGGGPGNRRNSAPAPTDPGGGMCAGGGRDGGPPARPSPRPSLCGGPRPRPAGTPKTPSDTLPGRGTYGWKRAATPAVRRIAGSSVGQEAADGRPPEATGRPPETEERGAGGAEAGAQRHAGQVRGTRRRTTDNTARPAPGHSAPPGAARSSRTSGNNTHTRTTPHPRRKAPRPADTCGCRPARAGAGALPGTHGHPRRPSGGRDGPPGTPSAAYPSLTAWPDDAASP